MPPFDVLGMGVATVDELLYVDRFPPPDHKQRVDAWSRSIGGLTAVALVAAARMGAHCGYAGVLGPPDEELTAFIRASLESDGIDVAVTASWPSTRPVHAMVVVGGGPDATRNIFGHRASDDDGRLAPLPPADVIQSARVLFVDGGYGQRTLEAARLARAAGVPIVADFEGRGSPVFDELEPLCDHLIVPLAFARAWVGRDAEPVEALVPRLWAEGRRLAAVTDGARGCWYAEAPDRAAVRHQPAFAVEARDTTGCGDVFHGVYAAALAEGLPAERRVLLAAAAGALKAAQPGGQAGVPYRHEVEALCCAVD